MWTLILLYILSLFFMEFKTEESKDVINTIQFPFGGPFMGLFVTLSIPLGLKEEDVFLGYNMEANYNLPENQTSFSYPPILGERAITRSSVYQFLSSKLSRGNPNLMKISGGIFLEKLPMIKIWILVDKSDGKHYDQKIISEVLKGFSWNCPDYRKYHICSPKYFGYPGYECLLRLICDIAVHPLQFSNGVLGDLFHVFLTPSSSNDSEYLQDYLKAEEHGNEKGNCLIYSKNCSHSALDLFTTVVDIKSSMEKKPSL